MITLETREKTKVVQHPSTEITIKKLHEYFPLFSDLGKMETIPGNVYPCLNILEINSDESSIHGYENDDDKYILKDGEIYTVSSGCGILATKHITLVK